jgi:DHA1 family inner membrane transport protein
MRRTPLAIWAMVIAAFAMGADEFIVAGVINDIARDLQVTIGAVGGFESAYALGVAVGAPLFVAVGTRVHRRRMLLATASVFVAGNALSALGPTYQLIMAGRVVSAMAHGAFFGIAAVFAAELVDQARRGRAIATIFAGATAATVLGAPLGAAVGHLLGWRFTFWSLVIFGGVALLGLIALLPRHAGSTAAGHQPDHADGTHNGHAEAHGHGLVEQDLEGLDAHARMHAGAGAQSAPLGDQLRALRRGSVWLAIATTMLGYGGVFTSYTYIAPQLTEVTGFAPVWITPLLLLFGAGLFVGNYLGGRLADQQPMATLVGTIAALSLVLVAMPLALESKPTAVAGLLVFGAAAFSVVAPLQLRVVTQAGDAPDVASALNISAFTLGSAIGIYLGGWAIDGGLGLTSVNWIGGLIALAGLILALISWRGDRKAAPVTPEQHHVHGAPATHATHHH